MILKLIRKILFDYRFFLSKDKVYVLMFHKVNDDSDVFYKGMPTKTFYNLIEYIILHFQIVHFEEVEYLLGKQEKPLLVITFDDGMDDIRTNVYDFMMERKVKFTINIDTKILIDSKPQYFIQVYDILNHSTKIESYYDSKYMKERISVNYVQPYETESAFTYLLSPMRNSEKEDFIDRMRLNLGLQQNCFTKVLSANWIEKQKENTLISFGSHSHSHPIFSELNSEQIKTELSISRNLLEEILHKKIEVFAYPNGEAEEYTDGLIQNQGFKIILKTGDRLNHHGKFPSNIFYRINMYQQDLEMAILQSIGLLPKLRDIKTKIWN